MSYFYFFIYITFRIFIFVLSNPIYNIKIRAYNNEDSITLIPGQYKKIYIEISSLSNIETQQAKTNITISDKTNFQSSKEKYSIDTNDKRIISTYIGIKCNSKIETGALSFIPEDSKLFSTEEIVVNIDRTKINIINLFISDHIIAPGSYGIINLKEPLLNMENLIIKFEIPKNNKNDLKIDDLIIKSINEEENINEIISNQSYTKFYSLNLISNNIKIENIKIKGDLGNCYLLNDTSFNITISNSEIISNATSKHPKLSSYILNDDYYIGSLNTEDLIKPSFLSCVFIKHESKYPSIEDILKNTKNNNDDDISYKFYFKQFISNSKPYFRIKIPKNLILYHNYKYKCIIENNAYIDSKKTSNTFTSEYFISMIRKDTLIPTCYDLYFDQLTEIDLLKNKLKSLCLSFFNEENNKNLGYIDCYIRDINYTIKNKYSISICQYINPLNEIYKNELYNSKVNAFKQFMNTNKLTSILNITLNLLYYEFKKKNQNKKILVYSYLNSINKTTISINLENNLTEPIKCYYSLDKTNTYETDYFSNYNNVILNENSNINLNILFLIKEYDNLGYNLNIKCSTLPNFLFDLYSFSLQQIKIFHGNKTNEFCNNHTNDVYCIKIEPEKLPMKNIPKIIQDIINQENEFNKLTYNEKEEKVEELLSTIFKENSPSKIFPITIKINILLKLYNCEYIESQICRDFKLSNLLYIKYILNSNINFIRNNTIDEFITICELYNLTYSDYFFYLIYQIGYFGYNGIGMDIEIIEFVFNLYNSLMNISKEIIELIENQNNDINLESIFEAIQFASSNILNLIPFYEYNIGYSNETFYFLYSNFLLKYNTIINSNLIEILLKSKENEYITHNIIFNYYEIKTHKVDENITISFILNSNKINITIPKINFENDFKDINNLSGFFFMFYKSYKYYDYLISMNIIKNNIAIYDLKKELSSSIIITYQNISKKNYICHDISNINSIYIFNQKKGIYNKNNSILICKKNTTGISFMSIDQNEESEESEKNKPNNNDSNILIFILSIIIGIVILFLGGLFHYKVMKKDEDKVKVEKSIALVKV